MGVGDVTAAATAAAPASASPTPLARPRNYRAGVVGTGFMGHVHARAIRNAGGQLTGVVASNADRSRLAATELDTVSFANIDALVASDDVDVVHVCTPNHLHAAYALAAIRAGKHVVCEKPLATTVTDATALLRAAGEAGVVASVPFVYRFHPMVREARERVRRGSLGRLNLAHGTYLQDWLLRPSDNNWRVDPALGGATRAFGDIGSHWCDLLEFTSGDRITALTAQLATVVPHRGDGDRRAVATEDIVTISFSTDGGMVGTAVISQVAPGRKNQLLLEISGSDGTISFDQEQPERLWVGDRKASRLLVRDPETLSPPAARYSRLPAGHAQGYQDCFDHFVADTAAAIDGDEPDGLPLFADGVRAAVLADAVLRSAAERRWVDVSAPTSEEPR